MSLSFVPALLRNVGFFLSYPIIAAKLSRQCHLAGDSSKALVFALFSFFSTVTLAFIALAIRTALLQKDPQGWIVGGLTLLVYAFFAWQMRAYKRGSEAKGDDASTMR